jgi:hypothetical protein
MQMEAAAAEARLPPLRLGHAEALTRPRDLQRHAATVAVGIAVGVAVVELGNGIMTWFVKPLLASLESKEPCGGSFQIRPFEVGNVSLVSIHCVAVMLVLHVLGRVLLKEGPPAVPGASAREAQHRKAQTYGRAHRRGDRPRGVVAGLTPGGGRRLGALPDGGPRLRAHGPLPPVAGDLRARPEGPRDRRRPAPAGPGA